MNMQGVTVTFTKMDMNAETTALLDVESGLLLSSIAETDIAMDMKMEATGQTMTQKMTGKGKTVVTVSAK
jgi:hypothetical protein